jgi:hypothetical protein
VNEPQDFMEPIGKSKIGRLSAKGFTYPQLRLPQQYANIIGEIADVFEIEHQGKQAFLIVTERAVLKEDKVLKPSEEVLKPVEKTAAESRLSALESEISNLKSALFLNESFSLHKNKNRWARGDSNARPSPCKGSFFRCQRLNRLYDLCACGAGQREKRAHYYASFDKSSQRHRRVDGIHAAAG